MKPHLFYIASPNRVEMTKLSIESFNRNSRSGYYATVIVNTLDESQYDPDFGDDVDVVEDKSHYADHPPARWFVESRSDICLFLDHDMFAVSDVSPLLEICRQTDSVCGVIAYRCRIGGDVLRLVYDRCGAEYEETDKTWIDLHSIPRYYNYGVLAVPKKWQVKIRETLPCNINTVNEMARAMGHIYLAKHGGQVALAITLSQLKIPTHNLQLRYNYPNDFELEKMYPEERSNVVFWHCLNKNDMTRLKGTFSCVKLL